MMIGHSVLGCNAYRGFWLQGLLCVCEVVVYNRAVSQNGGFFSEVEPRGRLLHTKVYHDQAFQILVQTSRTFAFEASLALELRAL